jgi:hypothetical protein
MSEDRKKPVRIRILGWWMVGIGAFLILLELATPYSNPEPAGAKYILSTVGIPCVFLGVLLVIINVIEPDR